MSSMAAGTPSYEGLLFSFAEMEKEIEYMLSLAKPHLSRETIHERLPAWKRQLVNFRTSPGSGSHTWHIPADEPIETKESSGEYEPFGRQGGLSVIGRISGAWEIHIHHPDKKRPLQYFRLLGQSSFKVSIWRSEKGVATSEIARWSSDVGDDKSPGCHFHTQIDLDAVDGFFPKGLSVPRLPAFLLTPMDLLEFLIAELFQDRWLARASKGSPEVSNWASIQRPRLVNMLAWHADQIRTVAGSPWTAFKRVRPQLTMLIGSER